MDRLDDGGHFWPTRLDHREPEAADDLVDGVVTRMLFMLGPAVPRERRVGADLIGVIDQVSHDPEVTQLDLKDLALYANLLQIPMQLK